MDEKAIEAAARGIMSLDGTRPYKGVLDRVAIRDAQAALSAYHAHLEAAGFAIVPVEPTEAMVEAGWRGISTPSQCWRDCYRAMIAATKGEG